MEGVRLRGLPPIGGTGAFPETNVRTYVHREGKDPGVWFFSLDAASAAACRTARTFFRLPYHHARMSVEDASQDLSYSCRRLSDETQSTVRARISEDLDPKPGSLDYFLVERYLLYAKGANRLRTGRVWHRPYPLKHAEVLEFDDALLPKIGIVPGTIEHVCFSPGVDVKIYPLK
jgi:uncharacterized protein YqjF (DUF2071 family)